MNKYIAELFGTFTLAFVVYVSIANELAWTPVIAMLTLGLFVYSIGHVSGCHINPAVTLGLLSIKKINLSDAAGYIIAQFIGAALAMVVAKSVFGLGELGLLSGADAGAMNVGLAEGLGMILFTFGIASVVYGKASKHMSGLVVGGSLLLGIMIATVASNGVLNPAVAYGIGSFNLMYLLGPVIGAVIGMQLYKCLCSAD